MNYDQGSIKFTPTEATALLDPNRHEPEFGDIRFTLHMDMWRLITITGVKEEAIWANSKDRRHDFAYDINGP